MPYCFTSLQLIWISFPCSSSPAWACPSPQRRNPLYLLSRRNPFLTSNNYGLPRTFIALHNLELRFYAGCTSGGVIFGRLEKRPSTIYAVENPGVQTVTAASRKTSSLRTIRSPVFYAVCQASVGQQNGIPSTLYANENTLCTILFRICKSFHRSSQF